MHLNVPWGVILGPIAVNCYQQQAGGRNKDDNGIVGRGGKEESRLGKSLLMPALSLGSCAMKCLTTYPWGGAGPQVAAAKECLANMLLDSRIIAPCKGGDDDKGNARDCDGGCGTTDIITEK
jgi:hypothetical protein